MWEAGWVSFDTETTGFTSESRIVEIGIVYFERGEPVHQWEAVLCPEDIDWNHPAVVEAMQVNGIDPSTLLGKPAFRDVLPQVLVELAPDIVVAHNARFDLRMVNQELRRLGLEALSPELLVCTQNLATHFSGRRKGNKLGDVAARYGVAQPGAHRASVDAEVCGRVLAAMMQRGEVPDDRRALAELLQKAERSRNSFR